MSIGIICALVAMLAWGFGDFLIQRSLRKVGDWETLFIITLFGTIILLPFVWHQLPTLFSFKTATSGILLSAGLMLFLAALAEFEALRRGKLSVIEPTWSLEIPTSVLLAFLVLGERLSGTQILIIIALIIGLFLVSYRGQVFTKRFFLEKGVVISIFSALLMGAANFFVGWGARETDSLLINFSVNIFSMVGTGIVLLAQKRFLKPFRDVQKYPRELLLMCVLDNGAWIAFAFAMVYAPIGLAVALSESYIIIAVLLGIFINREKLQTHQRAGLIIAVISAIVIATKVL